MATKTIIVLLVGLTLASVRFAEGQQPKVYRVGVLLPGEAWYEIIDGLRVGLRQLGLEEGKQFFSQSEIGRVMQRRRRKPQGMSAVTRFAAIPSS